MKYDILKQKRTYEARHKPNLIGNKAHERR